MKTYRTGSIIIGCLFLSFHSNAQCNVFANADSANPVLSVLPAGKAITSLDFVDINADGKMDFYAIPAQGLPQLYHNIGTAQYPKFKLSETSGFEGLTTPEGSPVIQFVDIDGDNDYDCFITEVNYNFRPITTVRFYKNIGDARNPKFIEDETDNPVSFARSDNNYVQFTFADINKDGKPDFYYTGLYNSVSNDYDQFTYLNTGTKQSPSFALYSNEHPHDFERQRTYIDWNTDGLPDYIKYNDILNTYTYEQNNGPLQQPVFTANNMRAAVFTNGMPFRLVDLNNDGSLEAFTSTGHYSTIAPVPVLKQDEKKFANQTITRLYSSKESADYKYRWEFNNHNIPGYGKPFIYALLPGNYTLFITNNCGTGISLPYQTGKKNMIADNSGDADFLAAYNQSLSEISSIKVQAYPNPFRNEIVVQLPVTKTNQFNVIKITDLAGRQLLSQTTTGGTIKIGRNLPAGNYIVQIWQGSEMIYHTMIMKQ